MSRKAISIAVCKQVDGLEVLYVLFDDGTIWAMEQCWDHETLKQYTKWQKLIVPMPEGDEFIQRHSDRSWADFL